MMRSEYITSFPLFCCTSASTLRYVTVLAELSAPQILQKVPPVLSGRLLGCLRIPAQLAGKPASSRCSILAYIET